jgi:hypothetical protein
MRHKDDPSSIFSQVIDSCATPWQAFKTESLRFYRRGDVWSSIRRTGVSFSLRVQVVPLTSTFKLLLKRLTFSRIPFRHTIQRTKTITPLPLVRSRIRQDTAASIRFGRCDSC